MAKFNVGILLDVNLRHTDNHKFGTEAAKLTSKDANKALKYSSTEAGVMELCADNDEIAGFVVNVEAGTVDGRSFGSYVAKGSLVRQYVTADAALNKGDFVVAAAQQAAGTNDGPKVHPTNDKGLTKVKKKTSGTSNWFVLDVVDAANKIYIIQAAV